MRLPQTAAGQIDEEQAVSLFHTAREAGINYFDTAYPYHDGKGEPFVGQYLSRLPRSSFFAATKMPVWKVNTLDDAEKMFHQQLERLHTDYIDFYLLHAMNKERFQRADEIGIFKYLEDEQKKGTIRHFGFSFHDDYETFKSLLNYRNWDFCQIQYNYMDRNYQAGDQGLALTEKLGVPVIIMEPVKGGSLANLPDSIVAPFRSIHPEASTASWALRFAAGTENVHLVLSGMSSKDQLADNLSVFSHFVPLDAQELEAIEQVKTAIQRCIKNGCTSCKYCMPCPYGVDIPGNFRIWNDWGMYKNITETRKAWRKFTPDTRKAANCHNCGACEKKCPQKLNIRNDLKSVQREMEELNK